MTSFGPPVANFWNGAATSLSSALMISCVSVTFNVRRTLNPLEVPSLNVSLRISPA